MPFYQRRPKVIVADQWWRNGDHPYDRVGEREVDMAALSRTHPEFFSSGTTPRELPKDAPTYERKEGAVVRYFRSPDPRYRGSSKHKICGYTWHEHGWIDGGEGGTTVCPGDYVITKEQGKYAVIHPDALHENYQRL